MLTYSITGADNRDDFENAVNEALKNGWRLYGNLCVTAIAGRIKYDQALTKDVAYPSP